MKISTKGRYALRLMVDLALHDTGEYISIKNIAARQDISEKYLEQIITLLSRAGLVKSARGASGGYQLSAPPAEYTVGRILRVTEGSLAPVSCLEDKSNKCPRSEGCATLEVWQALHDAILSVVDSITLAELAGRQRAKASNDYTI